MHKVPFISLGNFHSMKLQTKQKIAEERDTMIIVFLDLLLLLNVPNWKKTKKVSEKFLIPGDMHLLQDQCN